MPLEDALRVELVRFLAAGVLLLITWFVGQRVILFWDVQKKRRELDLATEATLQAVYGEYKEVGRIWRVLKSGDADIPENLPSRGVLLARAIAAESRVEALLMKIAVERVLSPAERGTLGLFRQAYQQLRQAIREDKPIQLSFTDPHYHFFNDLACETALIIVQAPAADAGISVGYRKENLFSIARIRTRHYTDALARYDERSPLRSPPGEYLLP
jgi:hypothetical protein